ncbi:hypothetical protein BH23ACT7_BH23ACT7_02850 [soil metagenome]
MHCNAPASSWWSPARRSGAASVAIRTTPSAPALGGQALTIDTAGALPRADPAAPDQLLCEAKAQSQETMAEIKRR